MPGRCGAKEDQSPFRTMPDSTLKLISGAQIPNPNEKKNNNSKNDDFEYDNDDKKKNRRN